VDLTDLVVDPGVVEDPLGRRRLTGIDVGHDADIADLLQWGFACHDLNLQSTLINPKKMVKRPSVAEQPESPC
jgi:hypothetical protein